MKKTKLIALTAALAVTGTMLPVLVRGDEGVYNSENDPLVSLSYINEVVTPAYEAKISQLTTELATLSETIDTLKTELDALKPQDTEDTTDTPVENPDDTEAPVVTKAQYEVVYMEKGSKLMAKSPCEIILRTGTAIAVSIISNGLNDITNGTEIYNAEEIPLYHCLLVPRGEDGRGIQITSPDSYVMVRGEYEIVQ